MTLPVQINAGRIARNTAWLYLRHLVFFAARIAALGFVVKPLGVEGFGLFSAVSGVAAVLCFFGSALGETFRKFLSREIGNGDEEVVADVFGLALGLTLVSVAIAFGVLETAGSALVFRVLSLPPGSGGTALLCYEAAIGVALSGLLRIPFESLIYSHERMSRFAGASVFEALCVGLTAAATVMAAPDFRLMTYVTLSLSGEFALLILFAALARGLGGFGLRPAFRSNVSWTGSGTASDRRSGVFPSAGRFASTHADATHFSNVKGAVKVENCLFEGMMDDAINVHSTCLAIQSLVSPTVISCRYVHPQAVGFDVFLPGERLRFIRGATLENGPEMTVTAVARRDARTVELTLDGPVPEGFGTGDAVENADYQPSVVFNGNIVRNNRARAALFTTPRPVTCASNLFQRVSGSAVLLAGDAQKWYESGACADVDVFANVFSNCCASGMCHGSCKGVISICPSVRSPDAQKTHYHRNARIHDNEFFTFDVPLLYAFSAEEVTFTDNRIRRNDDYPGWGQPAVVTDRCWNVKSLE